MSLFPFPTPMLLSLGGLPAGTVLVGNSLTPDIGGMAISGDTSTGAAFQALASGSANTFHIIGNSSNANTANFYLCVYDATSESVWGGSLLGNTAIQSPLGISENRAVSLPSLISIVAGNWYALTVLPDSLMFHGGHSGTGSQDRGFSDAYSDGPAATAGALGLNTVNTPALWLTT